MSQSTNIYGLPDICLGLSKQKIFLFELSKMLLLLVIAPRVREFIFTLYVFKFKKKKLFPYIKSVIF